MFIGHFAAGFATKKIAPQVSLGTMFMATQFIDLIWPLFMLAGWERAEINPAHQVTPIDFTHYPYSHSLLFVLIWALLFGGIHFAIKRNLKNALVLGGLVLSHWFLDLIVHRPDLPLWMGSPLVGFGLWGSLWGTLILEMFLFLVGVIIYYRTTSARNKKGQWLAALLVALLFIIHMGNMFGPPPPSIMTVAMAGNLTWLFVGLAYWADRNR